MIITILIYAAIVATLVLSGYLYDQACRDGYVKRRTTMIDLDQDERDTEARDEAWLEAYHEEVRQLIREGKDADEYFA